MRRDGFRPSTIILTVTVTVTITITIIIIIVIVMLAVMRSWPACHVHATEWSCSSPLSHFRCCPQHAVPGPTRNVRWTIANQGKSPVSEGSSRCRTPGRVPDYPIGGSACSLQLSACSLVHWPCEGKCRRRGGGPDDRVLHSSDREQHLQYSTVINRRSVRHSSYLTFIDRDACIAYPGELESSMAPRIGGARDDRKLSGSEMEGPLVYLLGNNKRDKNAAECIKTSQTSSRFESPEE